jgi:hypothetical protein
MRGHNQIRDRRNAEIGLMQLRAGATMVLRGMTLDEVGDHGIDVVQIRVTC